jgi:hypothetical protein
MIKSGGFKRARPLTSAPAPSAAAASCSKPGAAPTWPRRPAGRHLPRRRPDHVRQRRRLLEGAAEEILGEAIKGRRDKVLISTKATFRFGDGAERRRLLAPPPDRAVDAALKRLGTDYIDLFQLHGFDARRRSRRRCATLDDAGARRQDPLPRLLQLLRLAPDEVAGRRRSPRLDALCRAPGVLLAGRPRLRVGADAAGAGSGRRRRGVEPARLGPPDRQDPPRPAAARRQPPAEQTAHSRAAVDDEYLYDVVDALDAIAQETGKTVSQVALNWLLQRPTVSPRSSSAPATRSSSAEPRRGRLEPHAEQVAQAGCGQRAAEAVPVLAPDRPDAG